jgi:hypothetical protein
VTYRGLIKNGVVVFEEQPNLPDGVEVTVDVVAVATFLGESDSHPTLYERLQPVVGQAKGLPPDAARNVDDYLYGKTKE